MDITIAIILLSIFAIWFLLTEVRTIHKELRSYGVPYEGFFEFHKNAFKIFAMLEHSSINIMARYNKYKGQFILPTFDLTARNFIVLDASVVKQITVKDFDAFINHSRNLNAKMDRMLGQQLFSLVDDDWRCMRSTLSPMFTSSRMKMMFGILTDCVDDFIAHFEQRTKTGSAVIDCKETFSRFTVDGICSAVLGFKGDCVVNEDSELFRFTMAMQKPTFVGNLKIILFEVARKIYILLRLQLTGQAVYDFFYNVIVQVMNDRESKGIFRPDMIQLLLQAKRGQLEAQDKQDEVNEAELSNFSANIEYDVKAKNKKLTNWTDEHFMAQGFMFFAAGFEATSILLQVTSFWLAKDKEIQQKLVDEVDQVVADLNGSPVTYEALHKMKYLDMVICEALRLWPPAPLLTRQSNRDYKLNIGNGQSLSIKNGSMFYIPIYAIHRDERYFEDPEKFDPERFSDERKGLIADGSYAPFGSGPRVCIGSRFTLMEAKLLIFNILKKFTLEVCDQTPENIELKPNFASFDLKSKIYVQLKQRP